MHACRTQHLPRPTQARQALGIGSSEFVPTALDSHRRMLEDAGEVRAGGSSLHVCSAPCCPF